MPLADVRPVLVPETPLHRLTAAAQSRAGVCRPERVRLRHRGARHVGHVRTEARLLVVDDEPDILELLSASLRFAGWEVATATNGADALDRVRELQPDRLVLDVLMPGLNGFAVAPAAAV